MEPRISKGYLMKKGGGKFRETVPLGNTEEALTNLHCFGFQNVFVTFFNWYPTILHCPISNSSAGGVVSVDAVGGQIVLWLSTLAHLQESIVTWIVIVINRRKNNVKE